MILANHICRHCGVAFKGSPARNYCSKTCGNHASKNKRHGQSKLPEYTAWRDMRGRCQNPNYGCYDRYGAKGITVCERWDNSYEAFLEDMGPFPGKGWTIDRIDSTGNYEPGNCRWATRTTQSRNRSISWKPEEDAKIIALASQGFTFRQMGAALGRSQGAVTNRAYRLGLKSGQPRKAA